MFYFNLQFLLLVSSAVSAHAALHQPNDDAFETHGVITVLCTPDYGIIAIIKPYFVHPSTSCLHSIISQPSSPVLYK